MPREATVPEFEEQSEAESWASADNLGRAPGRGRQRPAGTRLGRGALRLAPGLREGRCAGEAPGCSGRSPSGTRRQGRGLRMLSGTPPCTPPTGPAPACFPHRLRPIPPRGCNAPGLRPESRGRSGAPRPRRALRPAPLAGSFQEPRACGLQPGCALGDLQSPEQRGLGDPGRAASRTGIRSCGRERRGWASMEVPGGRRWK